MAPVQEVPNSRVTAALGSPSPADPGGAVLITGAGASVCRMLAARYREEQPDRELFFLLPARDQQAADEVRWQILDSVYGLDALDHLPYVTGVRGDIIQTRLGLDAESWAALAERVDEIVHGAALVDLSRLELAELEEYRLHATGTEQVCRFAEECLRRGGLHRIVYASSLEVVGDYAGTFRERDLDVGQGLIGAHQRTTYLAEQLVRSHDGLPWQIHRLGTVVGDGRCGWIPHARSPFYRALKTLREGGVIPADPSAQFRFIALDDAAERIYHLAQSGEPGETYHVVGPRAISLAELVELMKRVVPGVGTQVVEPSPEILEALQSVLPEFAIRARFDDARARAVLDRAGVRPAREMDESLLRILLRYVDETDWGARPMTLPDALDRIRRGD